MLLFLGNVTKPRFSGKPGAWWAFKREWEQFIDMGSNLLGRRPDDKVLLHALRDLLDPTNRLQLMYAMETQGDALSYLEVWQRFREKYERDATAQSCHAWQQVTMGLAEGAELTLAAWASFVAAYRLRAICYPGRSPMDGRRKEMDELPAQWKAELVREESKRKGLKAHCKMWGIGLQQDLVGELLEALCPGETCVWANSNCFWITCPDKQTQRLLLDLDRTTYAGVCLRVQPMELKMSAEDMFQFIEGKLQVEEEIRMLTRGDNTPPRGRNQFAGGGWIPSRTGSQGRRWPSRESPTRLQAVSSNNDPMRKPSLKGFRWDKVPQRTSQGHQETTQ